MKAQRSPDENNMLNNLHYDALEVLSKLISTPSFSRDEGNSAMIIQQYLADKGVKVERILNNVWAVNKEFDPINPTIILCSHHDTVQPNKAYTLDPFDPLIREGKLYGLGSNDAGAALVALIGCFLYFYPKKIKYNLIIAAVAEEEISGSNGIEALLNHLPFKNYLTGEICAIVGEPTGMEMAVAEKGLLVLDCKSTGKAGHAARDEGDNAIYKAMKDIEWLSTYRFPRVSPLLGPVKMTVTSIDSVNKAHNIIPSECNYVMDVRVNELYTFEEVTKIISENISAKAVPRSTRLVSSAIDMNHPLVKAGLNLGKKSYGSPTTSDKAMIPFPALKIGPGDSARSHTADEFIFVEEISDGMDTYIDLLNQLL